MYTHSMDMKGASVVDWGVDKTLLSGCSAPAGEMAPLAAMAASEIEILRSIEEGEDYERKRSSAP